ncbi:MAG: hypothetical protein QOF70_2546 [Acetobacteraceae bacterium]|jgi:hypothetical protein|nr:hypothetical protein [Acetobacteraceae bacterium]
MMDNVRLESLVAGKSLFRRSSHVAALLSYGLVLSVTPTLGQTDPQHTVATVPMWAKTANDCEFKVLVPSHVEFLKFFGVTWSGACVDGRVSGFGTLVDHKPDGDTIWQGTMQDGVREGHGVVTLPDGSSLSGDWRNGVLQDPIVLNSSKGMHYEGQSNNGVPEGEGTATWPSGARYDGHWQNGAKDGHGIMKYVSKGEPTYDGMFKDGQRSGHGTLIFTNGTSFEGEWLNDALNGPAKADFSKGFHFEGEMRDGKINGFGTMVAPNGSRYEGQWRDGKPDGEGTLTKAGLTPYSGKWQHGCFMDGTRRASFTVDLSSCT